MTKLNVVVMVEDGVSSFERLLVSVKHQTVDGIAVTAVTNRPQTLEKLKDKYDFTLVESKGSLLKTLNETVRNSSSEFVMISSQVQMFEKDFYETVSPYLSGNDLIALNVSRFHRSGNFYKIFPSDDMAAVDCLKIRPCVYGWIISTALLKKNKIELKSVKINHQLEFLEKCLKCSKKNCYIPLSRVFIDKITKVSGRSFISALAKGKYASVLIKQSLKDWFDILTSTRLYKFVGRVKRLAKVVLKRIAKRLLRR